MSICHCVICSHSLENSNVLLKSIVSMDLLVFGQSFVGLTWIPCCYPVPIVTQVFKPRLTEKDLSCCNFSTVLSTSYEFPFSYFPDIS